MTAQKQCPVAGYNNNRPNTVNNAPIVVNSIADQLINEDLPFSLTFVPNTFTDVDGDTLTYSATKATWVGGGDLPTWLRFDDETRTFSGTPLNGDVGSINLMVTAFDGNGGSIATDFVIIVDNTNDAPIVDIPIGNQSATENVYFEFTIPEDTFIDVDISDTLAYRVSYSSHQPLDWLSFVPSAGKFSGRPDNDNVGDIDVIVTVTDNHDEYSLSASDTFTITVTALPPTVIGGSGWWGRSPEILGDGIPVGGGGSDTFSITEDTIDLRDVFNFHAGEDSVIQFDADGGGIDTSIALIGHNMETPALNGSILIIPDGVTM